MYVGMSKENNNLRLLGSPVNLSYRNKKKEDRKNIRNRPRSAFQNSSSTDNQERLRRPYSADTKDQAPATRNFLKTFTAELLQSYNNSPLTVKVLAPTEELLNNNSKLQKNNKDICSNASDYGSEDTFVSLGTKIKAKAQSSTKNKSQQPKNFLKYRNIAKRGRKAMEVTPGPGSSNDNYEVDIRITEKLVRSPSPPHIDKQEYRTSSPTFKYRNHQLQFKSYDDSPIDFEDPQSSFNFNTLGIVRTVDTYTHSLMKQQLSLVEEESNQDLDSLSSQHVQTPKFDKNAMTTDLINIERADNKKEDIKSNSTNSHVKDNMFYEDFHRFNSNTYKIGMSSTYIPTDTSSKDSGYPESVHKEDRHFTQSLSLPNTTVSKKITPNEGQDQPQSFNNVNRLNDKVAGNSDGNKSTEPLNHSRLLYKDFFLKKEGHIAVPPNNSPIKSTEKDTSESSSGNMASENENMEYPSYLVNSSTKAYTSKVIEDYKKEIEAINNLHELTLKDIKMDAISPTPLNIDHMFEQYSNELSDDIKDDHSQESTNTSDKPKDKNALDRNKQDVTKVTTKELIQNYFKIKGDYKTIEALPKNLKKYDRKLNNATCKYLDNPQYKKIMNNKVFKTNEKSNGVRNQKNAFTVSTPLSARLESVQNDKDVESWVSLSSPSPRVVEIEGAPVEEMFKEPIEEKSSEDKADTEATCPNSDKSQSKELTPKSTVLDIYTMLKEIESYGDKPVVVEDKNIEKPPQEKIEERCMTPKDNFMEIFEFLEKVEQSANDALSVITNTTTQSIPKLDVLLRLPQTELAQRLVTASLQLEERSCCIALLQESLTNHKQQMINKVNNLEKQSHRNIAKVKQECEEAIKRHQSFIDQLINDKKTLNHRIEQLVDERRTLEERWRRSAQALEERYKLELRNQHDKMAAAQQVARQRWVKQKAEKIKELTVKGLESELREMAERQQKEVSDLKMCHAEQVGRLTAKHANEMEELRRSLEEEKEVALVKERQLASSRMEKQILELELTYQEQRTRLVADMRAENERVARELAERERVGREDIAKWKEEQEKLLEEKRRKMVEEMAREKEKFEENLKQKHEELQEEFERYKREYEMEQQMVLKRRVTEIAAQHKLERDREIEKAIESMEAEAQAGRRELQEALRRNKEQYEAELKELGETEQATLKRYQDAQARIRLTEDRCADLEMNIGQLETRNRVLTEKNSQLETRSEEVREACEREWRGRVDALEREREEARKTHEEQMHQLYAKVKVAVARKDSAIQALTREAGKYQEKITLLEQKLQQQRKDFFKSK